VYEPDIYLKVVADTHVDGADPLRFLLGTECSPFSANGWVFAGALFFRGKYDDCREKENKSDGKEPQEEHTVAGERVLKCGRRLGLPPDLYALDGVDAIR
jgi:hypothetical protein